MGRMKRTGVSITIRREIFHRDNHRCMKCGRSKQLEVHHILPVYQKGLNHPDNLITLCRKCHEEAPDEPFKFFNWCSKHLPPELERSKQLTKTFIFLIMRNPEFKDIEESKMISKISEKVDEVYKDFWNCFVSNDVNQFTHFLEEHYSQCQQN